MLKDHHIVIMAGGIGSRFWPVSTPERPKQFIDVLGCGKTLIQMTADRFKELCMPENIWVVTSASYAGLVAEQLPFLRPGHILCEPCMRNTAPCIAYAAWKIKQENPDAKMVVTPSDHIVIDTTEFRRVVSASLRFIEQTGAVLTLGMKPVRPETGYGYIEGDLSGTGNPDTGILKVNSFKEKPDIETARSYIERANFFWNSGVFIWNVRTIVQAISRFEPVTAGIFDRLVPYLGTGREQEMVDRFFPDCRNVSIDYAVLEKYEDIYVFPADFGWSDLGTWGSIYEQLEADGNKNVCIGKDIRLFETRNCIIDVPDGKKTVVQGLDGYIVAEKDGRLLICKMSEEQRIKDFSQ